MSTPAQDGYRLLAAVILGLGLGICYGFLRPLRPRHALLSDLLFLPIAGYAWLYLGFAICRGDIRLGYCMGLLIGGFAWELTLGRWLRPIFFGFWQGIFRFFHGFFACFEKILKKIRKIAKFLFARWKKWFTIILTHRRRPRRKTGGVNRGKEETSV